MTWSVTLEVVDCASPATHISGASIWLADNSFNFGTTDAYGQRIIVADDIYDVIIVTISKPANEPCKDKKINPAGDPGYVNKNFTVDKANNGKIQTVCLMKAPWPDCTQTGISCFIVTATTGSPESVEVNRLRELRDRVSTASTFGAQLIDVIYSEYAQFSPRLQRSLRTTKHLGRRSCNSWCGRCSPGTRWLEPLGLSEPTRKPSARRSKMW